MTAGNRHRYLLLFGVWLLYGAFGLVATSLAPLVGLIETDLQLSHAAMGSVMGAWQLVYIFSAIPCGMLLDRLGTRKALTLGALLVAASAGARAISDSYLTLMLAVMLFGLGGPIVSAGAPKVITRWFTGTSRGMAMGIYMTAPAVGGIISLSLTHSLLLPALGTWRNVLGLWCGVGVVAALLWWLLARDQPTPNETAVGTSTPGLPHGQVLWLLLNQPTVRLVLGMSVAVFLFNHGLNNWLPELLRRGGMTLVEAGYWAAIPTVIGVAGSLLIPRLATPGRRFPILAGLALAAAAASLLLQLQSAPALFSGLVLQGIARSALMTVLILTLVELPGIGERHAGTASGLFFSAAEVGGVLGPISLGLLYDWTGDFDAGLYLLTAVATLLWLAVLRLKRLAAPHASWWGRGKVPG